MKLPARLLLLFLPGLVAIYFTLATITGPLRTLSILTGGL
jgi:hypothetical protein